MIWVLIQTETLTLQKWKHGFQALILKSLQAVDSFKISIFIQLILLKRKMVNFEHGEEIEKFLSSCYKHGTKQKNLSPLVELNLGRSDSGLKFSNHLHSGWLCWLKMKSHTSIITSETQIINMSITGFLFVEKVNVR